MKTILLAALAAVPLGAQPISQQDRDFAVSHLEASRKAFLDSVAGLSEAQWKFKPGPDRWSIAETAEHIAVSEGSILQLITEKILKGEPVKDAAATRADDEAVIAMIRDRSKKATAPEFLRPSGRYASRDAVVAEFNQSRDRTIEFVGSTQAPLRSFVTPHPVRKTMDAYQWVLLNAAHAERHTAQIQEVKAHPDFPK